MKIVGNHSLHFSYTAPANYKQNILPVSQICNFLSDISDLLFASFYPETKVVSLFFFNIVLGAAAILDSLKAATHCLKEGLYKDSINRSYYAAFYAVKAVLALSTTDFKRHKDVMGYCNKEYVAQNIFRKILNVQKGLPQNHQNRCLHGSLPLQKREMKND